MQEKLERDIEDTKNKIADQELTILRAKAKGNEETIKQEELNMAVMEQTLELMEDHNMQRKEALRLAQQIVASEEQAKDNSKDDEEFKKLKNKIKEEELKLINMGLKGSDKEIEKQKKKIELMERVLELQKEFGLSEEEAANIARGEAKKSKKDALKETGAGEIPTMKLDDIANKIFKGEGAKAGDYFHSRSIGGGETVFDKYLGGSKQGTFSEAEMRKFIGEKALGQDTDDSQVNILEEIKTALEGKFVSE